MLCGDCVEVLDRVSDLLRRRQQRSRCLVLEVEVEPARDVPVLGEVVREEEHRLARDREVEHRRRVVRQQDVGREVEVANVLFAGDVDRPCRRAPRSRPPEHSDACGAAAHCRRRAAGRARRCRAGGRTTAHRATSARTGSRAWRPRGRARPGRPGGGSGAAGRAQQVVARIARLEDAPLVAERAAKDLRAERVRRHERVPPGDVALQALEEPPVAGELGASDVERDLLQAACRARSGDTQCRGACGSSPACCGSSRRRTRCPSAARYARLPNATRSAQEGRPARPRPRPA